LPDLSETLLPPDASDSKSMILEADELWSFVFKKNNKIWVWIVLCRKTRQVIAYVIGDRSEATCQKLWDSVPSAYKDGHCYTDFWSTYQAVIPKSQHTAVGKETGETAHVKQHMWSDGIIRYDSVLVVLYERPSLFLNLPSCITSV
jgi:insertion element IS1 protein InsB